MNVNDLIIGFICKELLGGGGPQDLTPDDDLLLSGLIDSLGVVWLIHFMEETFSIHVPPQDVTLENFLTVQAIGNYVKRRQQEG